MKPSGIGGMAVMEGVMMKNKDQYAVAVRKPNNEITVEKSTHKDFSERVKLFKLPLFRGMLAFVDSLLIGVKVLNYSASFFDEEEETEKNKKNKKTTKKLENNIIMDEDFEVEEVTISRNDTGNKENHKTKADEIGEGESKGEAAKDLDKNNDSSNTLLMILAVMLSLVISITLFMVLPVLLTNLLSKVIESRFLMALIEGIVRLSIFIGYVLLASRMKEIKRVFMYHGAEHKTINCLENGFELTLENVKWQSRLHKRCGTSFMLLVILISLIFFMILPTLSLLWRVLSRVILVPFIAGVSYEFIRLAGKSDNKLVHFISKPGLWMQGLTTKEPDDAMIEVAIQSVDAVFDWRAFQDDATSEVAVAKEEAGRKKQGGKSNSFNAKKLSTGGSMTGATRSKVNSTEEMPNSKAVKPNSTAAKPNSEASMPTNSPVKSNSLDDEDDEILRALDKYFDYGTKDSGKSAEDR